MYLVKDIIIYAAKDDSSVLLEKAISKNRNFVIFEYPQGDILTTKDILIGDNFRWAIYIIDKYTKFSFVKFFRAPINNMYSLLRKALFAIRLGKLNIPEETLLNFFNVTTVMKKRSDSPYKTYQALSVFYTEFEARVVSFIDQAVDSFYVQKLSEYDLDSAQFKMWKNSKEYNSIINNLIDSISGSVDPNKLASAIYYNKEIGNIESKALEEALNDFNELLSDLCIGIIKIILKSFTEKMGNNSYGAFIIKKALSDFYSTIGVSYVIQGVEVVFIRHLNSFNSSLEEEFINNDMFGAQELIDSEWNTGNVFQEFNKVYAKEVLSFIEETPIPNKFSLDSLLKLIGFLKKNLKSSDFLSLGDYNIVSDFFGGNFDGTTLDAISELTSFDVKPTKQVGQIETKESDKKEIIRFAGYKEDFVVKINNFIGDTVESVKEKSMADFEDKIVLNQDLVQSEEAKEIFSEVFISQGQFTKEQLSSSSIIVDSKFYMMLLPSSREEIPDTLSSIYLDFLSAAKLIR